MVLEEKKLTVTPLSSGAVTDVTRHPPAVTCAARGHMVGEADMAAGLRSD